MTKEVQARFDYPIIRHILNSAGIERFGQYAFDMVRIGDIHHTGIHADIPDNGNSLSSDPYFTVMACQ